MNKQLPAPVQVIRSRRKTLCLEIHPDARIILRAPMHLSQEELDKFLESRKPWLLKHLNKPRTQVPEYTQAQAQALMLAAKTSLPLLVAQFSGQMRVRPKKITITSAKKRFGSCNAKGNLCFSWRLMAYPPEAVAYVVAHELAHLKHLNHSPAFYQFLSQHMPDYQNRAALLKQAPVNIPPEEVNVSDYSQDPPER